MGRLGFGFGPGVHQRRYGGGAGSVALSAPGLTRTSGVSDSPITVEITLPIDWDAADGTITGVMERSTDPTFLTDVQETENTITGAEITYDWGFSTDARSPLYARWYGYQGGTSAPALPNYSPIIGAGDAVAPTITSSNTITLASGVGGTLNLTANELIKSWAITGGANADQFSITSGSVLAYAAQTVGGSYTVQVTATDYCDNTTDQTITATLQIVEFSTASTDKQNFMNVSGTPKLTAQGTNGVGAFMNVRLNAAATGKRAVYITPTIQPGDIIVMGIEDGTTDFSAFSVRPGGSNSAGISLSMSASESGGVWTNDWEIDHTSGAQQWGYGVTGTFANGDGILVEYDTATGTFEFFIVHFNGTTWSKTQLGTTITGLSSSFDQFFVATKNNSTIVVSLREADFPVALTTDYNGYGD